LTTKLRLVDTQVADRSATLVFAKKLIENANMAEEQDQQFVEFIIKAIVSNPDEVKVDRTVDERGVLLSVNVEQTDIGYVIGKRGQTVNAIRTLAKVVGAKNNARVNLKVVEPEGSERPPRRDDSRDESRSESQPEEINTDVVDDLKI